MKLTGGCLCGAVRYAFNGTPGAAGWCHCRMCQRSSGAPAQTYVLLPAGELRYVAGEPALYRSSANGERRFCAACGSQLEFRDLREPETISLNSGTLDDPSLAPPDRHIWTSSEVPWFRDASRLTRFDDDG
jgi:hypothetical protein